MQKSNTQAINDQHIGYYFAKFGDAIDLTQCSRFAQGFVAADILSLSLQESLYLREMNEAQGKFIGSGITSGFGKAIGNMCEGAAEGAGGLGQGAAGAYQAEKSVENAAKISTQQAKFNTDLADFANQKAAENTALQTVNDQTATNAAQKEGDLQVTLEESNAPKAGNLTVQLESQPVAQPKTQPEAVQPKAPQTQTPVTTQRPVAEVAGTTQLTATSDVTRADPAEASPTPQNALEMNLQAEETPTPKNAAPTPEQAKPNNPEELKDTQAKSEGKKGTSTSGFKENKIKIPGSEEIIRTKHEGDLKRLDQENQKSNNMGTLIQGASQLSQTAAQGSRMYQQGQDVSKDAFDKANNALGSAGKNIDDTVSKLSQINTFQQNTTNR